MTFTAVGIYVVNFQIKDSLSVKSMSEKRLCVCIYLAATTTD